MKNVNIAGRLIGNDAPPYVIAELSANHNGNIEQAFKIIAAAKAAGADAVKLQTYTPDTITLNCDKPEFQIQGGLWHGRTLYDLYAEAHTPWDWHKPLFDFARKENITIFSSPFDSTAVDLLEDLNAPAYKIASFELIDLPLIRYVAQTKKPMIMSTGMANAEEIAEAIDTARAHGCTDLVVLHCVSAYPAKASEYNLRTLVDMQQRFGELVGLSDHTLDNTTAIASVALGACVIEKHFTLDRSGGGPDDSFSLEPQELRALCEGTKTAWQALGRASYERQAGEVGNIQFRRSLYFVENLSAGDTILPQHIRSVRPGFGLSPKYLDQILGKVTARAIEQNSPVTWDDIVQ